MVASTERPKLDHLMKEGDIKFGNDPSLTVKFNTIGITAIDEVLGRGFPRGRTTMLVGDYSSGKTFLSQLAIARVQAAGGTAAYIDAERSYDRGWFEKSGIDVDKLMIATPEYGEKAVDITVALLESNIDIVVLDSIAALIPTVEEAASSEQQFMGQHPKLVAQAFKKFTVANRSSVLICINQIARGMGQYATEEYPGGRKQRFFSHIILRLNREGWIEEQKKRVGFDMHIVAVKNKLGKQWAECTVPFYFNGEIDETLTNIDLALSRGHIIQKGPWYQWFDQKWQGKHAIRLYMNEHPADYEKMVAQLGE